MVRVDPRADEIIAYLPGVRDAVHAAAEEIAGRARATLARHRDSGDAHIEVTHGATDAHVSLVDEAALSIEYDHFTPDGTPVPGLRVLRDAADL